MFVYVFFCAVWIKTKLMVNKNDIAPPQVDVQWEEEGKRNSFIKKDFFPDIFFFLSQLSL